MTPRRGESMAKHFEGKMATKVARLSIPTSPVGLAIDIVLLVILLKAVFQLQLTKARRIRLSHIPRRYLVGRSHPYLSGQRGGCS